MTRKNMPPVKKNTLMKSSPRVESYSDVDGRGLLRWSLWEAEKKKCYICGKFTDFKSIQIDHAIPKTPKVDFDAEWAKYCGTMANNGVDHISNLRASCHDCNSPRLKGANLFSPGVLDFELRKFPAVMKAAFKVQDRIRRNGDIGESLVKVATADTNDDFDLLWDFDLNQAVIAALHAGSDRAASGRDLIVPSYISYRHISLHLDDESLRLLAAIQLTTGVSISRLLVEAVQLAIEIADSKVADFVTTSYEDFQGVSVGTSDWHHATDFSVSVDEFSIDMENASCVVAVGFHEFLILPLAMQSSDGGKLDDDQQSDEVEVEGTIQVSATMRVGHNPNGKSGLDLFVEDDSRLVVS